MTRLFFIAFFMLSITALAQVDTAHVMDDISAFRQELNTEFKDPKESPLEKKDFRKFKGLPFFPINLEYHVTAKLTLTADSAFFKMKTTTSRLPNYRVYGIAEFTLKGKNFRLPVYQSEDLMKKEEYKDYLFFPFTDLTNGNQTYSGGRFISLRIPAEGKDLTIDFNKAYNPYCAYSHRFSCPIVPRENHLNVEVPAGVMYKSKKK